LTKQKNAIVDVVAKEVAWEAVHAQTAIVVAKSNLQ
tara:strand:- start:709 stop:816 length:108 start_codon:yes stop_codon:yes gene_type:complete